MVRGPGGNRNNQWKWEGYGNKMGLGMEMNLWEREGMRLIKSLPLISATKPLRRR